MRLVFATNNRHKLEEIRAIAGRKFEILSLKEAGIETEIPEDHHTLEENALQKAGFIRENYGYDCFADDTGLEVDALGGEPGVYSARYCLMGDMSFSEDDITAGNLKKLLYKMKDNTNRQARFRTVIALVFRGEKYLFEGIAEGSILYEPKGKQGFGYDPVFCPGGYNKSFAEMSSEQKNNLSHRARALEKLMEFFDKVKED